MAEENVDALVALACRAPSVHNTQPWKFSYTNGSLQLRVDPSRQLRHADPSGRELIISCGAAITNLEVGLRSLGLQPRIRLLPRRTDLQLLATIQASPGAAPADPELRLLRSITRRHSHRGRFDPAPPAAALLAELRDAASLHGAHLAIITNQGTERELLRLAWQAEAAQHDGSSGAAEAQDWVASGPADLRRDGLSLRAFPLSRPCAPPGRCPAATSEATASPAPVIRPTPAGQCWPCS